jgi:hypothetical protein
MIDIWLKTDLNNIFKTSSVAVFIDESGDAEFLLRTLEHDYTIHIANSEIDELHAKYLIEREQPSLTKHLIYTRTPKEKLKFVRDYCEINGCLDIRYLQNYIKDHVHQELKLNINLPAEELIAAAKVSIGKEKGYWFDICHKGAGEIFDLRNELLPFIHNPSGFETEKYDASLREVFYRKVNELLKQEFIIKPAQTLANEVVKKMLDGLARNKKNAVLDDVYKNWLDSVSYKESFDRYLNNYKLPSDMDIWAINPAHPFQFVDEQWLKIVGENINNKTTLPNYLSKINQRIQSKQAKTVGITFWSDVKTLLEFDPQTMTALSSFAECVTFYTNHFYKLDTAIRNLYAEFLNQKELLTPFQAHYQQITSIFLDKWFQFFDGYQEQQTGILQKIIDENSSKIAVIVGDGVAYEIACQVAAKVNRDFKCNQNVLLADIPSETENNMSRIYMANGVTERAQSNREKYLQQQNPNTPIDFIKLDEVNDVAKLAQYLICTYKDIDDMGEKLQHKALKYFPETVSFFAEKITQLLNSGYGKVYLITDHGFVLTGLLNEADKIAVSLNGNGEKAERYIRTTDKQNALLNNFVEIERRYESFNYLYFAKNMNPFKTAGVYGFSHGGLAPQELITPYFCWQRGADLTPQIAVTIQNKVDLKSVTGELFQIKLQADSKETDVFSINRKVYLVFYDGSQVNNRSTIIKESSAFIIQRNGQVVIQETFDGYSELKVQLLDAETKEKLDDVAIKKNRDRDLGGLF